ncbi:balbiani ring protein 3-like isoform X2 [Athalia rosae]|uniref:balbiani ring protein 3-like isoform X2 n=1 Tax=Athalia rosae TaxID=37344 RepID=UPI002034354C|nr:balbiani ring protein 3-like isoform X2 [Athalia rosae]
MKVYYEELDAEHHATHSNGQHEDRNTAFQEVDCSEVSLLVDETLRKIECNEPRIRDVQLIPPSGWRYEPEVVAVKRCYGKCSSGTICLPKETGKTKVAVEAIYDESNTQKCNIVEVEEHYKCGCDCPITVKQQCNAKQKYVPIRCECVCKDADKKKYECESTKIKHMQHVIYGEKLMTWNPKNCSCGCSNKLKSIGRYMCSTGRVWDPKNCQCIRPE